MSKLFDNDLHNETYWEEYEEKNVFAGAMIFDYGREKESLDGYWKYGIDQYDTCIRAKWYLEKYYDEEGRTLPVDYSYESWPEMKLPCCFNMAEEQLKLYEGSVIYTRTFRYETEKIERVFLKIGAANYVCRVFLNKNYVGMHRGGSTPFYVEITEYLQKDNRIIITCDSTRRASQVPMDNTDWFNYGGIHRSIELLRVPHVFIKDFVVGLDYESQQMNEIKATVELSEKIDAEGVFFIDELGVKEKVVIKAGVGNVNVKADVKLWSTDCPKLYDVRLQVMEDTVSDKVGFRKIEVKGDEILLNGKPVFLRGISCHEESLYNGRALTDEERLETLQVAKDLGCNFMRLAHYPHHENMSRMADELGILLWEEIPVYWAIAFSNKATYVDASNQFSELIKRDRNRASVIIWSVGNENADTDERLNFMSSLAKLAKTLDPTRLVSAACLVDFTERIICDRLTESLDVIGVNEYCGWYLPNFDVLPETLKNSNPDKPVIITEFGADAKCGMHGTNSDKGTEEYQAQVYKKQVKVLGSIPYVKGMTPWILYDFRCPRRLSTLQNYYNLKGLLSTDKKYKKLAYYVLQDFYKRMAEDEK